MSKNINQLEQVTFVNAASLPYAKVDVDGNTLFAGRNGAGKTTILRAVLYFYGAFRSEQLGISRTKKKRFEEFYFVSSNSYLIYTFSNQYTKVLAFVYKTGGVRLKYRFAKVPADFDLESFKELLFVENKAKDPKELFNALVGAGFELSPVLNSPKEYKNVLYGQDRTLLSYSFYQANASYEQIAKTISNIFINSKLDSGSIKQSLASSVSGFEPIDLAQIEQKIDLFSVQYDDIKAFEKNLPTINDAIESLKLLTGQKEGISSKLLQLQANASVIETESEKVHTSVQTLKDEHEENKAHYDRDYEAFETQKLHLATQMGVLDAQIKEAKAKQAFYEAQDIQSKLSAYKGKEQLQSWLDGFSREKAILTQGYEDVTQRFEALKRERTHSYEAEKQQLQAQINMLQSSFNQTQAAHHQAYQEAITLFEQSHENEKQSHENALNSAKEQKQRSDYELRSGREKNYLFNELNVANEALRRTHEQLQTHTQTIFSQKKELELIYEKKSSFEKQLFNDKELLHERYMQNKKGLDQTLISIESKLERLEKSVAGFLEKSTLPHKAILQTILKDEVLFSTELSPYISEGETLLGLELDLASIEPKPILLQALKDEKLSLQKSLDQLKRSFDEAMSACENEHKQNIKLLQKNEIVLRDAVSQGDLDVQKLERAFLEAKEALISLEKKQIELKAEAIRTLELQALQADKEYEQARASYEAHKTRYLDAKRKIATDFENQRSQTAQKHSLDQEALTTALTLSDEAFHAKLEALQKELTNALQEQGIDGDLLASLDKEMQKNLLALERIKEFEQLVQEYHIHKRELFDTLADKEKTLAEHKEAYNQKSFAFAARKKEFELLKEAFEKAHSQLQKRQARIQSELKEFKRFANSALYENFTQFVTQSVEANDEPLGDLVFAIQDLESAQSATLLALQRKLQKVFDKLSDHSAFNLQRPTNDSDEAMIEAARALQTFMEEGKLETFKNEVARLYNSTLHYVAKDTIELLKADSEIKKVVSQINKTLDDLQGIKVIESVELKFKESDNALLNTLKNIAQLSEHVSPYESDSLFGSVDDKRHHAEMLKALDQLSRELHADKRDFLSVDDSFVLEFRAIENGHDTGFVPSLDGIGSNGTDVMVKAMVYIAMLSLAKKQSSKIENEVYFHCILDEVGILAPNYLKELIAYANSKQIRFINGAPDEKLVTTYKRLYMLSSNAKHQTQVRRLLAQA